MKRRLRGGAYGRTAGRLERDVESDGLSRPRGIRLRDHALQLHGDLRKPPDVARADGVHGGVEAGRSRGALVVAHHVPASRGRTPGWRDQLRARQRRDGLQRGADAPGPGRRALHRKHRGVPVHVAHGGHEHRTLPDVPAPGRRALAVAIVRGGFEYQGQKCSAASRVYVPKSLWNDVRDRTLAMMKEIRMGDVADFRNFMGAVFDKAAFERISAYLGDAKKNARILACGGAKGDVGWFIEPTLVQTDDPAYRLLCEEIFGPVVTAYVYDDAKWRGALAVLGGEL